MWVLLQKEQGRKLSVPALLCYYLLTLHQIVLYNPLDHCNQMIFRRKMYFAISIIIMRFKNSILLRCLL